MKFSCRLMGDEIMGVNLLQEIPELSIPVFFFAGNYDYTTPFVLVEQFYNRLYAPFKKLIWFEHSAHMPHMEEPDKFQRTLIAIGNEFCWKILDQYEVACGSRQGRPRVKVTTVPEMMAVIHQGRIAGQ